MSHLLPRAESVQPCEGTRLSYCAFFFPAIYVEHSLATTLKTRFAFLNLLLFVREELEGIICCKAINWAYLWSLFQAIVLFYGCSATRKEKKKQRRSWARWLFSLCALKWTHCCQHKNPCSRFTANPALGLHPMVPSRSSIKSPVR